MPTLYILCGPSGSGKSTWARKFMKENNVKYVSRDEIRFSMLKEGEDYFSHEKEVFKQFVESLAQALIEGYDVIADATHISEFSRCKLTQAIDRYTHYYQIIAVVFNTDVETCVKQNKMRTGWADVPENIIRNMCRDFRAPTLEEDPRIIEIREVG